MSQMTLKRELLRALNCLTGSYADLGWYQTLVTQQCSRLPRTVCFNDTLTNASIGIERLVLESCH